jgi:hypothetical protein
MKDTESTRLLDKKHLNYTSASYSKQYLPRKPGSAESSGNISHLRHVLQQLQHPILQIILSDLGSGITGGIRLPLILEAKMDPPLQWLDPAHRPVRNHRSTTNLVACLQPLNLTEKKVNLLPYAPLGIPIRPLHRRARSTKRKGRRKILNIKPH